MRAGRAGRRVVPVLATAVVLIASMSLVGVPRAAAGDGTPPRLLLGVEMADPGTPIDHLVLLYDEVIDPTSIPAATDYHVSVNGNPVVPTSLEFVYSGFATSQIATAAGLSFLKLSLPVGLTTTDTVTLSYTPGLHPIRDLARNEAPAGSADAGIFNVNDVLPGAMSPVFAVVDADHGANRVVLLFNRPVDSGSLPAPTDFTIKVNGVAVIPTGIALVRPDLNVGLLDVILPVSLVSTDTVLLSYTPGAQPIRSRSGDPAAPIVEASIPLSLPVNSASMPNAAAGSTISTATGAPTIQDPVGTSVTTPAAGSVSVAESNTTDPAPPGYAFFGQQVLISAPPAPDALHPLVLRFELDASVVPFGQTAASVEVFRNGVLVDDCIGPGASPTPCVSVRDGLPEGDIGLTVLTVQASRWNFAIRPAYAFGGFRPPVDGLPTLNRTSAGSAIPVKFSLGGNRGLQIFAAGSPTSLAVTCSSNAAIDDLEQTVTAGSSSLSYSAGTDTYTYVWKSIKSWSGTCRRLTLDFADGSTATALFDFRR